MLIGIDGNEANQKNRVGIGQFAFNILKSISEIDKDDSFLIYLKENPLPDLPKENERWHYRIFGPGKLWTQLALPVKLFTQKEKLAVFYSPSHYAPRFSPFPTVISMMDLWHHRHPEQFAASDLYQLKNWENYSVRKAKRIITISEFSRSEIVKFYHYPEEKIKIAYPGFDRFDSNIKYQISNIHKKYNFEGDYLLYLGTLQPKKNLVRLVEAFALVIRQLPITLVIAGKKGWLYEEIFNKVKELKLEERVIFTGFIDEAEKPYLIAGAGVFVLPSLYEGFGIPVLEAMSLGVPVVSSSEGSLPEAGGKAAFYCNPYRADDISQTILKVLSLNKEERNEIIKAGLSQVEKFSWEKCAKVVLETLKNV
ncbi:hypothetical protein COS54_01180 [Candidatus Shapirobacteria bacterium CG03_land_8_20_14_0_80_39_12]|uniref:Glycosyltransferase family 1 protein n=1 Tax=Candidatus Shapirobacteria bacterium CG03_land_8_20_14_0_80_39_12 TaxID=1974879 RepID=A0A2M7BDU0_9BACT|nr:MAG: hypothetical protein COS54_01180 [Candidatus Shapirobacteria bacterium CG03_land_8_20_14_0_80_39_12]